jgi:hypothetical protein
LDKEFMKKQILLIHGGDVFDSYEEYLEFLKGYRLDIDKIKDGNWKDNLQKSLGSDFEVIYPQMPGKYNAKYAEWKIWLEKYVAFLRDDVILIGGSLGGIFLAKYLSENKFPLKINSVFLLGAPLDDEKGGKLNDFKISGSLDNFNSQAEKIFLFNSRDDEVVPFAEQDKYSKALPKAEKVVFEDRGHFTQAEIPELVEKIKSLK